MKAAHEPFIPAPWHLEHWDAAWPQHEPRPPNYNCSADQRQDKHGNIATQPMLSDASAAVITDAMAIEKELIGLKVSHAVGAA